MPLVRFRPHIQQADSGGLDSIDRSQEGGRHGRIVQKMLRSAFHIGPTITEDDRLFPTGHRQCYGGSTNPFMHSQMNRTGGNKGTGVSCRKDAFHRPLFLHHDDAGE